jgi:hypothetical protein
LEVYIRFFGSIHHASGGSVPPRLLGVCWGTHTDSGCFFPCSNPPCNDIHIYRSILEQICSSQNKPLPSCHHQRGQRTTLAETRRQSAVRCCLLSPRVDTADCSGLLPAAESQPDDCQPLVSTSSAGQPADFWAIRRFWGNGEWGRDGAMPMPTFSLWRWGCCQMGIFWRDSPLSALREREREELLETEMGGVLMGKIFFLFFLFRFGCQLPRQKDNEF